MNNNQNQDFHELSQLIDLINEVSREEDEEELFTTVIDQLVHRTTEIFDFDYAVISLIDFLKLEIRSKYGDKREGSQVRDPGEWISESNYRLNTDEDDILTYLSKNGDKPLIFEGDTLVEPAGAKQPKLNSKIFVLGKHDEVKRIFITIQRRANKNLGKYQNDKDNIIITPDEGTENKDLIVGVLEAGYHLSRNVEISYSLLKYLQLFADNIAQPYYNTLLNIYGKTIPSDILQKYNSEPSHLDYLDQVVQDLLREIKYEDEEKICCDVSYFTFHDEENWTPEAPITFGDGLSSAELTSVRKRNINNAQGVFRTAVKKEKIYIVKDVDKDKNYIKGIDWIKSQITIPIYYLGDAIGAISFYSDRTERFNEHTAILAMTLIQNGMVNYRTKRLLNFLSRLVKPIDIEEEIEIVIARTFRMLLSYFQATEAAYFTRDKDGFIFRDYPKTSDAAQVFEDSGGYTYPLDFLQDHTKSFLHTTEPEEVLSGKFGSYLVIPFFSEFEDSSGEANGFITIYSKRTIKPPLEEDNVFLDAVQSKIELTLKNHKLYHQLVSSRENIVSLLEVVNLGQMAIGYSHDARTSMSNLSTLTTSLLFSVPDSIKNKKENIQLVEDIERHGKFLNTIFNRLVKIGKNRDIYLKPVPIKEVIDTMLSTFEVDLINAKIYDKTVLYNCDERTKISCDISKLTHVFLNLIKNSIYSVKEAKGVRGSIKITVKEVGEFIEVVFRDNGIGFTEKAREKAFLEQYSTKGDDGSGFGLMVVKKIVEQHGGRVKVLPYTSAAVSMTFRRVG